MDRSDRGAASISTAPARPGSRRTGKGPPPKCRNDACPFGAGPSGNTCRTVTNLCEALSMAVRSAPPGQLSVFPMDRLTKRSIFCPPAASGGRRRGPAFAAESVLEEVDHNEENAELADGPGHDGLPGRLRRRGTPPPRTTPPVRPPAPRPRSPPRAAPPAWRTAC